MIRRNRLLFFLVGLFMLLLPVIMYGLGMIGFSLEFMTSSMFVFLGSIGAALLAMSRWGSAVKVVVTLISALMVLGAQLYGLTLV